MLLKLDALEGVAPVVVVFVVVADALLDILLV